MTTVGVLAATLSPILFPVMLLELATRWRRAREQAIFRQIALTDAIGEKFGAIVAPVVEKPMLTPWGPWRIRIAVPFGRPGTVARLLAVAHAFGQRTMSSGYEIVLTAQDEPARREVTPRGTAAVVSIADAKAA